MICSVCEKQIRKNQKFNFLMGAYAHGECDEKIFRQTEPRIIKVGNFIDND